MQHNLSLAGKARLTGKSCIQWDPREYSIKAKNSCSSLLTASPASWGQQGAPPATSEGETAQKHPDEIPSVVLPLPQGLSPSQQLFWLVLRRGRVRSRFSLSLHGQSVPRQEEPTAGRELELRTECTES